jgi:hypothetical protein
MERRMSRLSVLLLPALTACATLNVQPDRVKSVKTVAVVGYTAAWDVSSNSSNSGNNNRVGATAGAIKAITRASTGEAQAEREERGLVTYDALVEKLREKMSWSVLDREALGQSGPYQERVESTGPHPGGGLFNVNNRFMFVDGVLRHEDVRRMAPDERRALMDALGVDAIAHAFVRFNVEESGFSVGGLGNRKKHPVATVEFYLYDKSSDEPIWAERFAKGRRAEKMMSQNIAGVTVERETIDAVAEAATYGYEEMIERFLSYEP